MPLGFIPHKYNWVKLKLHVMVTSSDAAAQLYVLPTSPRPLTDTSAPVFTAAFAIAMVNFGDVPSVNDKDPWLDVLIAAVCDNVMVPVTLVSPL